MMKIYRALTGLVWLNQFARGTLSPSACACVCVCGCVCVCVHVLRMRRSPHVGRKGLEDCIGYSVVHPTWQRSRPEDPQDQHHGWTFRH